MELRRLQSVSLSTSIRRRIPWLLAVVLLAPAPYPLLGGGGDAESSPPCSTPEDLEIARVDERNHRLFVIAAAEDLAGRKQAVEILTPLAEHLVGCHPDWQDRWSITFVSDQRFAGYKDEPEILPGVKDGSWDHGYLAEYSRRRSRLVRFPMLPDRRVELELRIDDP